MDEEKKGFNLNVLISLLVGVISLIVVIPSISMIMNKTRPEVVKPDEYRLIVNRTANYSFTFTGSGIAYNDPLNKNFTFNNNVISLSITPDNFILTLSYPDEGENYFEYLSITDDAYTSADYTLTYLDPVSNEKLYGTYDFSNITITEAGQVLNPIYTPF